MARRVLIVGNFLSKTRGARSVCEELAFRLEQAGWEVVTTSEKPGRAARLLDMLHMVWRHRAAYDVAQVDVYSGPAFLWAEAVCLLLQILGKPFVLTLHGGNLPVFARRWPGRVARLLKSADAVTTPAPFLQREMAGYADDLRLLRNGIDLGRYDFRLRRGVKPYFVWLRAFHNTYNPAMVPSVLYALAETFPDVRITMVGPDKGDGSLQEMQRDAARLGVADRLILTGNVPKQEVPGWLNQGDIFLNTTNVDNVPVSVVEAMACGLCVVSTDVGGMPYLVDDEHDGLLVPPGDPKSMTEAIRRLLTHPDLARRLSENGRRKAEAFEWSGILQEWDTLLAEVAEGTGRTIAAAGHPLQMTRVD